MKMTSRKVLLTASALAAILAPGAAYGATVSKSFNTSTWNTFPSSTRIPSSSGSDPAMSGTSAGFLAADAYACPSGYAALDWKWIHDLTALPDVTEYTYNVMPFCQGDWATTGVSWPSGHYHWDGWEHYYPQDKTTGYFEAVD